MEPREVIRAIAAPTGDIGAAYYFHPDTLGRGKELGLDGLRFYFLGRGGVLGDVEPEVVLAAFGYFEPTMLAKLWNTGKERIDPRQAAREHLACNAAFGRRAFAGLEGLQEYNAAAAEVIDAAEISGLSLFAGLRAEPVPEDPPALAIHHAVLLRELRGSAHLLAVRASGLRSVVAHAIRRPDDVITFGWPEVPEVTASDRERLDRAEELTDALLEPAFSVLDAASGTALVAGTTAMHAAISASR